MINGGAATPAPNKHPTPRPGPVPWAQGRTQQPPRPEPNSVVTGTQQQKTLPVGACWTPPGSGPCGSRLASRHSTVPRRAPGGPIIVAAGLVQTRKVVADCRAATRWIRRRAGPATSRRRKPTPAPMIHCAASVSRLHGASSKNTARGRLPSAVAANVCPVVWRVPRHGGCIGLGRWRSGSRFVRLMMTRVVEGRCWLLRRW